MENCEIIPAHDNAAVLRSKNELVDSIYQWHNGLIDYDELERRARNYCTLFTTHFQLKYPGQRVPKITPAAVLRNLTP